jgi:hypothetical protein
MCIECPNCKGLPVQGNNYQMLLELAEAGKLKCMCGTCGHSWTPIPADQEIIASNIRKLMAEVQA